LPPYGLLRSARNDAEINREDHLAPELFWGSTVFKQVIRSALFESRSMSILQLDPPIPDITPKGDGYAHLLIDYGPEYNLLWVCFLDDSGECWTYDNTQIRAQKNITMGRTFVSRHQARAAAVAAE
jgi:hypothetical protein